MKGLFSEKINKIDKPILKQTKGRENTSMLTKVETKMET